MCLCTGDDLQASRFASFDAMTLLRVLRGTAYAPQVGAAEWQGMPSPSAKVADLQRPTTQVTLP